MVINFDKTLELLNRIADSKPDDYKYTTDPKAVDAAKARGRLIRKNESGEEFVLDCYYRFGDGTPACIVGHLLYALDPDYIPTEEVEASTACKLSEIDFDDEALKLLDVVQGKQDSGFTWKESIASSIGGDK